jgi:hypothetical protein
VGGLGRFRTLGDYCKWKQPAGTLLVLGGVEPAAVRLEAARAAAAGVGTAVHRSGKARAEGLRACASRCADAP